MGMKKILLGMAIGVALTIGGYVVRVEIMKYLSSHATVSPLSKIL